MEKLKITIIHGTTRKGNKSQHAAKLVEEVGKDIEGIEVNLINPADFDLPTDAAEDPSYSKIVEESDAFFIVTPEYNHSFPGSLKNLLDAEYKNYNHKAVTVAGVSSGSWGGTRVIESLAPILRDFGLVMSKKDVNFVDIKDVFDEDGKLKDEVYIKRIQRAYKELIWLATTLKWGRENL